MKCIKHDLGGDPRNIEIVALADLHLGSPKCNIAKIKERINYIASSPNRYAVLLGDIINNSTKTSVGDTYEEELSPMEQMKLAVSLLTPIKDKILGICNGNHERRTYKEGTDLGWFLATALDCEDKYDAVGCLLFIRFGKCFSPKGGVNHETRKLIYTMYITHGDGASGRTVGGKANSLERRGQIVDADVILTGHTHQTIVFPEATYRVDLRNSKVTPHTTVFVNVGSDLGYESYAELYGMKPSATLQPKVLLCGTKHEVTAWIDNI